MLGAVDLSALTLVPVATGQGTYHVELKDPIIAEQEGNRHIVAVRLFDSALGLLHRTDSSKHVVCSKIPWETVLARQVRYAIPENYGVGDDAKKNGFGDGSTALAKDVVRVVALAAEQTLVGHSHSITLEHQGRVIWRIDLPKAYHLVDLDARAERLVIVTSSDQGFKDGELQQPFNTNGAYLLAMPKNEN